MRRKIFEQIAYLFVGILISATVAYLWSFAVVEIWGYWAIYRVGEQWPVSMQIICPNIFFLVVVLLPTFFVLSKMPRHAFSLVLPISLGMYLAGMVYAIFQENTRDSWWWIMIGSTIAPVIVAGCFAWAVWIKPQKNFSR